MKRALKWVAAGLSAVLAVLLFAAGVLYVRGGSRLYRTYDIRPEVVDIPGDEKAVARGRHLAHAMALCAACHGDDMSGKVVLDEPLIATIYASNLTPGRGGVGGSYSDADYVRAIRHGVNREGRGLMIMHSDAYHELGASDLGALIAYLKSLPAVDHEVPRTKGAVLGRILLALGLFDTEAMPLIPAEVIDHTATIPESPPPGVSAEYGSYLVSISLCSMCHGSRLEGGPPIDEGSPPAPGLAPYAETGAWSAQQFVETLRTGITPHGRRLDGEAMPWRVYTNMTDEELLAIREYVTTVSRM